MQTIDNKSMKKVNLKEAQIHFLPCEIGIDREYHPAKVKKYFSTSIEENNQAEGSNIHVNDKVNTEAHQESKEPQNRNLVSYLHGRKLFGTKIYFDQNDETLGKLFMKFDKAIIIGIIVRQQDTKPYESKRIEQNQKEESEENEYGHNEIKQSKVLKLADSVTWQPISHFKSFYYWKYTNIASKQDDKLQRLKQYLKYQDILNTP